MSARTAAVGGPDGERWRVPQVGATVWRGQAARVGGGSGEWSAKCTFEQTSRKPGEHTRARFCRGTRARQQSRARHAKRPSRQNLRLPSYALTWPS